MGSEMCIRDRLKADSISFWACPIGYIGVTLLYNLAAFLVLDFFKVATNRFLDKYCAPDAAKIAKFSLFAENRASLASSAHASRAGSRLTRDSRASRATHQSIGNGDRLSGMSGKARQSEVDRLQSAVAQLATLVGALAGNNAQVKASVGEIVASVGGI